MRLFKRVGVTPIASIIAAALIALALPGVSAAATDNYQVVQSRGADQRVDYAGLGKYGPWDDRNYALTKADLSYLSKDEELLTDPIPAYYRIELRKMIPTLRKSGPAQYPRAAVPMFYLTQNGLLRDGRYLGRDGMARVPVNSEDALDAAADLNQSGNEFTVEINPVFPDIAIAGGNVGSGQGMYRSVDGGNSWDRVTILPSTCCDPTVDWSSDGTVGYTAALSSPSIGVSFWRTFDQGQTWVDRVDITTSGSDKEWIHVDKSPASPYQDNIYATYHNSNTMQFARSTNQGTSFTITAFPGDPSGIGSDITTDSAGNIYYFYGAFSSQTIEMLKSTDGGNTFAPASTVATTNASFDWPIPSMESRNAWIYAAADADRSGGPFNNSIYVAWTDTDAPESGTAANNHTKIQVAYSRDGGATWAISNPHPTADILSVDRFNQWLTVDANGTVHAVYYDTQHSVNRTGTDFYYAYSTDGAVTWTGLTRLSSQTSDNISNGQEWGDYNGISVVNEQVVAVWTDNRSNTQLGYGAEAVNVTAEPGFLLSGSPLSQAVCRPADLTDIALEVGQIQEFANPVTLSFDALPTGFNGGFGTNPVTPATPPGTSTASISVGAAVTAGFYQFDIGGAALDATDRAVTVSVDVFTDAPAAPLLSAPANGATLAGTTTQLTWNSVSGAQDYLVEIATDAAFTNVIYSETVEATTLTPNAGLDTETTYYWRVLASNLCGDGVYSGVFEFTTGAVICAAGPIAIPDNGGDINPATLDLLSGNTGVIDDLDVSIVATHTWVGDLKFTLEHVDTGTSVVLVDRPGVPASTFGCSNDNVDAVMDDESATPVETFCGTPGLSGALQPQFPLAAFDGETLGGTWTLSVTDNAGADTGTLDEWCLLPVLVPSAPDTDSDGVLDDVDNCTDRVNPAQEDSNADGIGNACDADIASLLDGTGPDDCLTNFADLTAMANAFFSNSGSPNWNPHADLTDLAGGAPDGQVDFQDLIRLSELFFAPPGPSANQCVSGT